MACKGHAYSLGSGGFPQSLLPQNKMAEVSLRGERSRATAPQAFR